jgi:hypothetical protein
MVAAIATRELGLVHVCVPFAVGDTGANGSASASAA